MGRLIFRWVWVALAAVPSLLLADFIVKFGINFPLADQWDPGVSGLFIKYHDGTFRIADLFAQHNEHRMMLPKAAFLLLGLMTGWDTRAEFWLMWVLAWMTSAMVLVLTIRTMRPAPAVSEGTGSAGDPWVRILLIWFLCNLCIFGTKQWENWVSGIGVQNVMVGTLTVAMVVVISSGMLRIRRTCIAGAIAVAATLTSGNGFLCWPIGALMLGWSGSRGEFGPKKRILVGWGILFVVTCVVYFYSYRRPPLAPGTPEASGGLGMLLAYPIAFSGSTFAAGSPFQLRTGAMMFGSLMIGLLLAAMGYGLYVWRRRTDDDLWRRIIPWLMLGAFAIGSGIIAAPLRARWGIPQAASSRYITFAMFLPVALINLVPMLCDDVRRTNRRIGSWPFWIKLPSALGAAIVVLEVFAYRGVENWYQDVYWQRRHMKAATLLANVLPGNPYITPKGFPVHAGLEDRARELSRLGYLHPPLIASPDARFLRAEENKLSESETTWGVFEGIQASADRSTILARGWAIAPRRKQTADIVFLTRRDPEGREMIIALGPTSTRRDDVASRLDEPRYLQSGWAISYVFPPQLRGQQVNLSAWTLDADTGKAYKLAGQATFVP